MAGALAAVIMLAAAPAFSSATGDVRAALARIDGLSSYEVSFGTGAARGTMDFVKPDSIRIRTPEWELVRLKQTTYMKMRASTWAKVAETRGLTQMADRVRSMAKQFNGATAADLGMRTVDGELLHAYRVKGREGSATMVYVARAGYVRSIGNGKDDRIRFSKFNQIGTIRAPI